MKPTNAERVLVQAYKLRHITIEQLWGKLGARALWVCAYYGLPWPTMGVPIPCGTPEEKPQLQVKLIRRLK